MTAEELVDAANQLIERLRYFQDMGGSLDSDTESAVLALEKAIEKIKEGGRQT